MGQSVIFKFSGQKSAQGILRLRNPNLGPNSGKQILDARILDPNSFFFVTLFFPSKSGPQKNSPSRNSPPKIHLPKFNPEIVPKNSHCPLQGHLADKFWLRRRFGQISTATTSLDNSPSHLDISPCVRSVRSALFLA